MKKIIQTILIFIICTACFPSAVFAMENATIIIVVNGAPIETDADPFLEQGEVMVPVKNIADALGYKVSGWDAYRAFVHDEIHNIQLIVDVTNDSPARMFNAGDGRRKGEIDNSVPPMKVGNHIYVPLRAFADAFDYDVQWDENTKTATLVNQLDLSFFEGKEANIAHSLLRDRLIISMPEGAENQNAHYGGIMGLDVADEYEMNLVLFGNGQTLTVNVSELYMCSTGNFDNDALLFIESIHANPNNSLKNTSFEPSQIDEATIMIQPIIIDTIDSDFIMGALVKASDDTLMVVKIYADPKAMTYPEDCKNLATQIINSIKVGTRSLIADEQTLDMGDFTIKVAPGYVPKLNRGPDFDVWYFSKLVSIGEPESSLGIYRGNDPSYYDSEKPAKTVKDIVLSRIITWRLHTKERGIFDKSSYAEVIIRTGVSGWDTYMHIFASPSSESDWKIIREMVRSLHDEKGTATFFIWLLYGVIFAIIIFVITVLLVVRKRRKGKRLTKPEEIASLKE